VRGPGCCLGTTLGLVLGVALAAGVAVAAWRWAPGRLEGTLRWVMGTRPAAPGDHSQEPVSPDRGKGDPGKQGGKRKSAGKSARPEPGGAVAAPDPKTEALRRKVRERVRRLAEDTTQGRLLAKPVEFTEQELQIALTDPKGPLGGGPQDLQADLQDGVVRLTWHTRFIAGSRAPAWLPGLPPVETSLDLEPRVENGRLLCRLISGRVGKVPLPGPLLSVLAPALPQAPRLPPRAGFLLPPGVGWVEVTDEKLRIASDPPWMAPPGGS